MEDQNAKVFATTSTKFKEGDVVLAEQFNAVQEIANKLDDFGNTVENGKAKITVISNEKIELINKKAVEVENSMATTQNKINDVKIKVENYENQVNGKVNEIDSYVDQKKSEINASTESAIKIVDDAKSEINVANNVIAESTKAVNTANRELHNTILRIKKSEQQIDTINSEVVEINKQLKEADEEINAQLQRVNGEINSQLQRVDGEINNQLQRVGEIDEEIKAIKPKIDETKSILNTLTSSVDYSDIDKAGTPRVDIVNNKFKFTSIAGNGINYAGQWATLKNYRGQDMYKVLDVVTYNDDLYACLKTNVASTANMPNNNEFWKKIISVADKTRIKINGEGCSEINFTADPQTQLNAKLDKSDAPVKVSDLQNDAGYITADEYNSVNTIKIKGTIEFYTNLPSNAVIGDAYIVNDLLNHTQTIYVYTDKWRAINEVTKEYCKKYATYDDVYRKVDKINGKGLSECDFTNELRTKLENLSGGSGGNGGSGGGNAVNYEKIELLDQTYIENLIFDNDSTWKLPINVDDFIDVGDEIHINISEVGYSDRNHDMVYVCETIEAAPYEALLITNPYSTEPDVDYVKCCDNPVKDVDCRYVDKQRVILKDLGVESTGKTIFVFVSEYDMVSDLEMNRIDYIIPAEEINFENITKTNRIIDGEKRVTYEVTFNGFSSSYYEENNLDNFFYFYYPVSLVKVINEADGIENEIPFNKNAKFKKENKPIKCLNCGKYFSDGKTTPYYENPLKLLHFVPKCYNEIKFGTPNYGGNNYTNQIFKMDYVFVGDFDIAVNIDKAMQFYRNECILDDEKLENLNNTLMPMKDKIIWTNYISNKWWEYFFLGMNFRYTDLKTALLLYKGNPQESFSNSFVPINIETNYYKWNSIFTGNLIQFNKATLVKKGKF